MRGFIKKYIASGKLVVEERYKELFTVRKHYKVITGESLYYLDEDLSFISDYKKQVEMMTVFGHLVVFIKYREFMESYHELIYFGTFIEKVSKILEIDLSFISEGCMSNVKDEIESMNTKLVHIAEVMEVEMHSTNDITHHMEIFIDGMKFLLKTLRGCEMKELRKRRRK